MCVKVGFSAYSQCFQGVVRFSLLRLGFSAKSVYKGLFFLTIPPRATSSDKYRITAVEKLQKNVIIYITTAQITFGGKVMRFLHISDLHFNPKGDGRTSRNIRAELIPYLKGLHFTADELLITGDYRHARYQENPTKEDINAVVNYIKEIAGAVGITDVEHIHLIPGNHDRSRKKGEARRMAGIRARYDPANGSFANEDIEFLLQKFDYFRRVCDALYGFKNFWKSGELHTYRVIGETAFLYLNTAIMHNCDEDRKQHRLIIGNNCFDELLNDISKEHPDYPVIVLAHHSPDYFEQHEKEAVEEILRKHPKAFLYLCGDAHEAWLRKVNHHLEITMGCLKHERNASATFLCGDTRTQEYYVHHWFRAWGPYVAANLQLQDYFPRAPVALETNDIEEEQKRIKNDTLLPWFKNSPTINVLFPDLFVTPSFASQKQRQDCKTLEALIDRNCHSNIVVTGEAGFGKTTLLRQVFLFKNPSMNFLYLHAKALVSPTNELRPYQLFVRSLLLNGTENATNYTILLDGIDEAYSSDEKELSRLINSIDRLKTTAVWFGWRKDHLNRNETEVLRQMTDDIIILGPWKEKMANDFVDNYANICKNIDIIEKFRLLVEGNPTIKGFTESPFQLSLLVYLLHNSDSDPVIDVFFQNPSLTVFSLYDTFFRCWVKKEHSRKTSYLNEHEVREKLWEISSQLYYHPSCKIHDDDTAIVDLLSYSSLGDGLIANGFFHRSFCAFFLADKAFAAVKAGDYRIIEALSTPMRNDVTDFLRSAISGCGREEIEQIQANLIAVYKQTDAPNETFLSSEARLKLSNMKESVRFVLKNELIYLVTRIPDPTNCIPDFLEDINSKNTDPYILLDLAYASTLTGPKHIALEYAKTLKPDSPLPNELINRSWTIAYFGDAQANPHKYVDKDKVPWPKAREARLKRFQDASTYKALRFRILDLPLMYCFYFDRNWKDVNEKDYEIIKCTDIENSVYSDEEKAFMRKIKADILRGFEAHLPETPESGTQ